MKTAKEIRELIQEKIDEAEALQALATEEERDFTDDEQTTFDSLLAQTEKLQADLAKAEKYEKIRDTIRQDRTGHAPPTIGDSAVIRPVHYRHGSLRAYTGQNAEANAYKAGQFLAATIWGSDNATQWCRDNGVEIRGALSTSDNAKGGYLVPSEMEAAIINLREEYGVFRRESRVVPMGSDTLAIPRRTSGLTAYFVTDNNEVTASDKAWDQVNLVAKKMAALCKYSSELSEDAIISIGDDLTSEIAYAFANKEDECGFNGTGASTYGGVVGVLNAMNAGSIYTAATGNTAFSTLDLADFEGVVGQLPQYAAANAKWYISRVGYYQSMARLMDAGGGNTNMTLADGTRQMMFLGYPVVFAQVLNAVTAAQTSTVIAAFGDLRLGTTMGSRRGVTVKVSDQRYLEYDQIGILGTQRVDINVHEKGTATAAGALIVLKTPAS